MKEHIFNPTLKRNRLPTEQMELLNKVNTDYCRGYNYDRNIKDVLDEIKYHGEIGGKRL